MNDRDMNSVELDDERAQLKSVHVPRDEKQARKLGGEIDNDFMSWLDVRMKSAEWDTYQRGSEDFLGIETDLEKLSKSDMDAARKLWKENTPPGMKEPFYLTPEFEAAQARNAPEQGQGRTSLDKQPVGPEKQAGEAEQESGYRIPTGVQSRYLVADNRFFFRDQKNQLAFEDRGRKMVTEHNNPDVAKSLVELAEAKGWGKIKVSGHEDFKREVWLQATLKGIEVTGYKAKDIDIAKLQELQSARAKNAIEHDDGRTQQKGKDVDEDRAYAEPRQNKADNFKGKLLEHGRANFDFNDKNDPNYFVKLETANGTKMHWGLDLERAVEHAGAKVGELIELERLGKKPVTVQEKQFDKDGQLIGYKPIETERVEWKATAVEKAKEVDVAVAKADEIMLGKPLANAPTQSKTVNPALDKETPKSNGKADAEVKISHYQIHDPFNDATYRDKSAGAIAAKAVELKSDRFQAITVDGKALQVYKYENEWRREDATVVSLEQSKKPASRVQEKSEPKLVLSEKMPTTKMDPAYRQEVQKLREVSDALNGKPAAKSKAPSLKGDYKVAATVLEKLLKAEGVKPDVLKRVKAHAAEQLNELAAAGKPAPGVKMYDRAAQRERPREKIVSKSKDQQQERSR